MMPIKADTTWRTVALAMLGRRDRFMQDAIVDEFSRKMKEGNPFDDDTQRIHVDGEEDFFITNIIKHLFYVIWEFDEQKNLAEVLAVTIGERPKNRREIKLLGHESHLTRLKPKYLWQSCEECINERNI